MKKSGISSNGFMSSLDDRNTNYVCIMLDYVLLLNMQSVSIAFRTIRMINDVLKFFQ